MNEIQPDWHGSMDVAASELAAGRLEIRYRKKGGAWGLHLVPDLIGVPSEDIEVGFRRTGQQYV